MNDDPKAVRPASAGVASWPQTSIRLPPATLDRLNAEADRRLVGRNLIVRVAIEEWLAAHEADPA